MKHIVTINGHLYDHYRDARTARTVVRDLRSIPAYARAVVKARSLGAHSNFAAAAKEGALTPREKRAAENERRATKRLTDRIRARRAR